MGAEDLSKPAPNIGETEKHSNIECDSRYLQEGIEEDDEQRLRGGPSDRLTPRRHAASLINQRCSLKHSSQFS